MENESQNLEVTTEEQADDLLSSIEGNDSTGIIDEPKKLDDEFELKIGDQLIKAKRDQVIQWAQQGHSAPGKISQLTRDLESWKKKWSEAEPKWKEVESKYGEVDSYVRKNPEFWDHVLKSYESRNQALQDANNPLAATVNDLRSQVQELIQYKNQIEETNQKHRAAQEDNAYMQSFEEIKKAYADIDFVTLDESGKNLEYKVLEHAINNGIKDFKTAFRDYYHDELMKRAEAKAKESVTKEKQKQTKLGILGVTTQPTKMSTANIRSKSYENLADEIKAELGLN